jgi:hypothetical protein
VRRQSEAATALWIFEKRVGLGLRKSGVALRLPPHSKDAFYSYFASEVLQSSNLAVVAAVLPFCSNLLRICARSN